jgi:hypothetical protein
LTEASWDDGTLSPEIDWRMSASLENVPRGTSELAEVTSLAQAVREWNNLDPEHRAEAVLTLERPVVLDGAPVSSFTGDGISALGERLRNKPPGI